MRHRCSVLTMTAPAIPAAFLMTRRLQLIWRGFFPLRRMVPSPQSRILWNIPSLTRGNSRNILVLRKKMSGIYVQNTGWALRKQRDGMMGTSFRRMAQYTIHILSCVQSNCRNFSPIGGRRLRRNHWWHILTWILTVCRKLSCVWYRGKKSRLIRIILKMILRPSEAGTMCWPCSSIWDIWPGTERKRLPGFPMRR